MVPEEARSRIILSPPLENFRDPGSRFLLASKNIAPPFESLPGSAKALPFPALFASLSAGRETRTLKGLPPHDFESCAYTIPPFRQSYGTILLQHMKSVPYAAAIPAIIAILAFFAHFC